MDSVDESIESAESERKKREQHLAALLMKTKERELVLHSAVPYDGDCLFHSIMRLIPTSAPEAGSLRAALVDYFVSQKCSSELKATLDDSFLIDLAQQHKDVSDDRVVKGLAEHLSATIHVVSLDPSNNVETQHIYQPNIGQSSVTITLGHIKGEHYVPLQQQTQEREEQQKQQQQRTVQQQKHLKRRLHARSHKSLKRRAVQTPFSRSHYIVSRQPQ
ncbi:uncharacterized protein LOC121861581 [Homarus americanus]